MKFTASATAALALASSVLATPPSLRLSTEVATGSRARILDQPGVIIMTRGARRSAPTHPPPHSPTPHPTTLLPATPVAHTAHFSSRTSYLGLFTAPAKPTDGTQPPLTGTCWDPATKEPSACPPGLQEWLSSQAELSIDQRVANAKLRALEHAKSAHPGIADILDRHDVRSRARELGLGLRLPRSSTLHRLVRPVVDGDQADVSPNGVADTE